MASCHWHARRVGVKDYNRVCSNWIFPNSIATHLPFLSWQGVVAPTSSRMFQLLVSITGASQTLNESSNIWQIHITPHPFCCPLHTNVCKRLCNPKFPNQNPGSNYGQLDPKLMLYIFCFECFHTRSFGYLMLSPSNQMRLSKFLSQEWALKAHITWYLRNQPL